MSKRVMVGMLVALFSIISVARGTGRGQAAIVIRDGAPLFKSPDGEDVKLRFQRGDAVAGQAGGTFGAAMGAASWQFQEKNGRVRVAYIIGGGSHSYKGWNIGWMNPADLEVFYYDACDSKGG